MVCDITNPISCIADWLFDFIVNLINLSLQPFLGILNNLMTAQVNISLFVDVWSSIIYVLSMFYGILLIYVGFKFIVSGESVEEREKAKRLLRNTIIMMILIQTSYYLYELIISISSGLTSAFIHIAGSSFFNLNANNFSNIGLEIIFLGLYLCSIITVSLFLAIRYLCVSLGIIFFPVAIFFYFIPFLQGFGKLILNTLGVLIFLPMFYSLVFLGASRLVNSGSLSNIQMLIVIGSFTMIIIGTFALILFVIIKSLSFVSKQLAPIMFLGKMTGVI